MEIKVEFVGEYTEEHERRLLMTSYRIWKRVLRERAAQGAIVSETDSTQTQDAVTVTQRA